MTRKLIVLAGLALIVAAGCSSSSGPADFEATATTPANDAFTSSAAISDVPDQQSTDTTGATLESGEPRPCGKIMGTVWYHFTPKQATNLLVRAQASFNDVVAVYRGGDLTHLTEVGCATAAKGSTIAFTALPNETYQIQIGGVSGQTGTATVRVDFAQQNAILLGNPGPLPSGWVEKEIVPAADVTVPVVGPNHVPLVTIDASQRATDPDFYDVNINAAGTPLPSLGINTGGALKTTIHEDLIEIGVAGVQATVRLFYRYDPNQAKCELEVGGSCSVQLPVSAASAPWTTTAGPAAEAILQVTLQNPAVDLNGSSPDVNVERTTFVRIPLLGQVTAIAG
jgi:hypothetical protein